MSLAFDRQLAPTRDLQRRTSLKGFPTLLRNAIVWIGKTGCLLYYFGRERGRILVDPR
jgi:hypothetical protein